MLSAIRSLVGIRSSQSRRPTGDGPLGTNNSTCASGAGKQDCPSVGTRLVIPDGRVNLVPNIGIIVGTRATLVVDAGMGLEWTSFMRELAKSSKNPQIYLTTTHFTRACHGALRRSRKYDRNSTKVQQKKWIETARVYQQF